MRTNANLAEIIGSAVSGCDSSKGFVAGPVKALMCALMFDALQEYVFLSNKLQSKKSKERFKETHQWIFSDSCEEYIFSFGYICEALGININYLRLGVLNAVQASQNVRARRHF